MPGGMVPYPAPAGHQAELNYIYGMVEELSRQLADNQRTLEEVVAGVGRVRSRARNQALGNEDLVNSAADEAKGPPPYFFLTNPRNWNTDTCVPQNPTSTP